MEKHKKWLCTSKGDIINQNGAERIAIVISKVSQDEHFFIRNLISAAPEMYELLSDLAEEMRFTAHPHFDPRVQRIRQLLSRINSNT